jgi:NtrC-family two-component system sensor histidine kinase KinB
MSISLRIRTHLAILPLLALMAILGVAAVMLLHRLGGRIDGILRENYDSVRYMERLKESLERIDSSYAFALAGQEQKARDQYQQQWPTYENNLNLEHQNITVPGEQELADKLSRLSALYRKRGDAFYARPAKDPARQEDYFGPGGLLATFKEIKDTADEILRINQDTMEQASRDAQVVFQESVAGLIVGLVLAAIVGGFFAWRAVETTLQPIRAVIRSAQAIRAGNLDQVVPVLSHDELGDLAKEFNAMARQLRHYRQSDYARLLRAQRTSQATIDSFPDPVLVVDPDGKVEMANPAAQRLFGFPGKTGDKTAANPWLPPDSLQAPLKEALQSQRPFLPEEFDHAILLHTDGKDHSFLPHILPIRDPWGYTLGAAVLLQDVTRFRLLDQIKSDLVATASHELKTPLTSIRLAHHLLLEEAVGPLTPKQTELLLDARDNTERLLAVVNNLLDLTRLEQGREYLDMKPTSPAELLRSAAETIQHRAEDKGITIAVEVPDDLPPLAVDLQRLGHALGNLLDNALTYTDRGGRITLSAAFTEEQIVLAVADTGIGIAPEHLPHIFDRFSRIPNQSRGAGTGLGLAIVREIVTAHGGSVTCDSQPGQGTTFRIRLPHWTAKPVVSPITNCKAP